MTDHGTITGPAPGKQRRSYPLKKMEVGDTFILECAGDDKTRWQRSLGKYSTSLRPLKFSTKRVENGIRVRREA